MNKGKMKHRYWGGNDPSYNLLMSVRETVFTRFGEMEFRRAREVQSRLADELAANKMTDYILSTGETLRMTICPDYLESEVI